MKHTSETHEHNATTDENICNMKYLLQHTFEIGETFETLVVTYVYSHCNICNIQI
jgi:hypothetical protein